MTSLPSAGADVSLHVVLDVSSISFSPYHVHVLTSVMKSFFRDMKEPLMTFMLYPHFIQAAGLSSAHSAHRTLVATHCSFVVSPSDVISPRLK